MCRPSFVFFEDEEGFFSVNYQALTPLLLEAIKEQHQHIEAQRQALDQQAAVLDALRSQMAHMESRIERLAALEAKLQGDAHTASEEATSAGDRRP